ncbi:Molybdopterin-synthase adenylyltransferase [Candidatus Kinetoplastibacterium sorsogonicusi]|uniref:Molybdopterin-synthase adenylyltransferase n=1 Tax=Candidatus Kinetoplastidibacterium kentomonadis TaxID=1576550 RepID=A0A3Q8F6Y7_9PROT|nr:HesA/MoeB/ThiF family protein [Candidatus Kinetoplastibacterium sorsogonicusi]AWD32708.1 Molybdopterin-synthase adenylyltransferase [Candidatus Kinetoplastibacterium sorsogonicusi]
MNDEQLLRYSRNILIEELGINGQEKLLSSNIVIFGVGGTGSAAALYLTLAGIKKITIVDYDIVELSNLQRQILHHSATLGQLKVKSAKNTLATYNEDVEINCISEKITDRKNLYKYIKNFDLVLDCTDNFSSRYKINLACVLTSTPLISGAAIEMKGQISTYDLRYIESPCYNCVFPENKKTEDINCANMGVLSPIVGTIGSLQAIEAIKILAEINNIKELNNHLLIFNFFNMSIRKTKIIRDDKCIICKDR